MIIKLSNDSTALLDLREMQKRRAQVKASKVKATGGGNGLDQAIAICCAMIGVPALLAIGAVVYAICKAWEAHLGQ